MTDTIKHSKGKIKIPHFHFYRERAISPKIKRCRCGKKHVESESDYRKRKTAAEMCDFCGKHSDEVQYLIAGPAMFICNECVVLCCHIIYNALEDKITEMRVNSGKIESLLYELKL